jgi:hypothetical protein
MSKTKIILWLCLSLVLVFTFAYAGLSDKSAPESKQEAVEKTKDQSVTQVQKGTVQNSPKLSSGQSENFVLFADCLDEFGGRASSTNYSERISSGGQPGVVGISQGVSFYDLQGYVHTAAFRHGDNNADGSVSVSDVVYQINYLFKGGPAPKPPEVGDVNCDNSSSVSDVVYTINYLFKGGPKPCNL